MNIKTQQNPAPATAETALLKTQESQAIKKKSEAKEAAANSRAHKKSYNVALSSQSKELQEAHQKAYDIAMSTPDIREDRVQELREKINNGTYEIDAGKIADGMLREAIKEKLAQTE